MAAPCRCTQEWLMRGTNYDEHAPPASFSVFMGALPKPPVSLTWPVPGFSHQLESSGMHHHGSRFAEPAVLTLWSSQATFFSLADERGFWLALPDGLILLHSCWLLALGICLCRCFSFDFTSLSTLTSMAVFSPFQSSILISVPPAIQRSFKSFIPNSL